MVLYFVYGAFAFLIYVTFIAMRKNGLSGPFALLNFFFPIFLLTYLAFVFRGNSRKMKVAFFLAIVFSYFLVPISVVTCRLLHHYDYNFAASDFVATRVTVLGWLKPIIKIEGSNQFDTQMINGMIYVFLTLLLNLSSGSIRRKDYSKIIPQILVDFVPGFNTATKLSSKQRGDVVTITTDAFADLWTVFSHREKIENRIADNVRIVELSNQIAGKFEFRLGVLKMGQTESGELISQLDWKECKQIDSKQEISGLWTWNIGSNGRPCWLDLKSHPNVLYTGPPRHGKSTAIQHLFSAGARQNPQIIFVVFNPIKPSDHAPLERDWYDVNGKSNEVLAGKSEIERYRSARRLDNFILLRQSNDLQGLVRWLDQQLIERNETIENQRANQLYEIIEADSKRHTNKLDTPRDAVIIVNICEYTILRDRWGEKGNDVAEALNRIETIALEGGNRGIHVVVDSQNATLKIVGYLRRASLTAMFSVTSAEIEFAFGVKTQPLRGIGIASISDDVRGIKTICSPWISADECNLHITDADRQLSENNRKLAKSLRRAVKHEMTVDAEESIEQGHENIFANI